MDLNDLLAEVDGIGTDYYVPSTPTEEVAEAAAAPDTPAVEMPALPPSTRSTALSEALEMVRDAELELYVELGTARLPLREVMALQDGGEFVLETHPDDPLKIFVDEHCVGYGEALLIDGHLAIRITALHHHPD
jgi:flagellar motor switch protein FliN/FliY